ncbi:fungal-specific transcription factor domain-containing protein [Calycina marina]|uniref:Fungal-specific transcription factor domain-containing protein n=1 Tax=Calycina marina TaxID=1763456 RepID=A0A9P7ZCD2_9HELO|nr:fungal-specific transcription factor domain-containing protein [Calycina marina]
MENSPYHPTGLSGQQQQGQQQAQQYGQNPSGVSPQQLQQQQGHTLPPLQPNQQHMAGGMYPVSAPHTPRTPATPGTPNAGNFSQQQQQQQQQQNMSNQNRNYPQQMVPMNNNYPTQYRNPGSMLPHSGASMSQPQAIAPAPAQNRNMPHPLRPMPPNGLHHQMGMQSPYGQGNFMPGGMLDPNEPPTHVVGSQGRRGILPSAPGRPPVTITGPGSTKNAMIPPKDADGKFPCPHCTKTYLHAKHLKRHLLRHTGDRPYMCILCRDTFSRSDILKRHFQKCSIRRGNPTGASHLSHAQNHLKKSHPGPKNQMGDQNDMMGNGMHNPNMTDPALQQHHFGIIPGGEVPDAASHMTNQQVQSQMQQQSDQLRKLNEDRQGVSNRASFDQGYNPGMGNPMPTSGMHFSAPQGQNGHSYNQSNFDFAGNGPNMHSQPSSSYQQSANSRPSYINPLNPYQHNSPNFTNPYSNAPVVKTEPGTYQMKGEPGASHGLMNSIYPTAGQDLNRGNDFPNWNFQNDPLQKTTSNRLILLCSPPSSPLNERTIQLRQHLTVDNINHFLDCFSSFQGHFPIIHMPSFRIDEASDGMLLGIVCIGAVYSDRITSDQVRVMMEAAKTAIEGSSELYNKISRQQTHGSAYVNENFAPCGSELEQITAIFLIHLLFTWHGTPVQREEARGQFPLLAAIAKNLGLTQPCQSAPFSALHQPHANASTCTVDSFDWNAWIQQEKRSRLMYMIFLTDAARVLYFNMDPTFDVLEIQLPLPADDACWDAATSNTCAQALGLMGQHDAQDINPEGSRRAKQPEMHTAMITILHKEWSFRPNTTNLFSKFVLIHALHVQLWKAQRNVAKDMGQSLGAPLGQTDWAMKIIDVAGSGTSTPAETANQLIATSGAFEKWKKVWDSDISQQYPPSELNRQSNRRFGFCRDAVHFYWLAKCFIGSNRALDLHTAPDQRFSHVMSLLQYVKTWVVSDSAERDEEMGSVADIDPTYAVTDLTLDMAQLFKPINRLINSPVAGVHIGPMN